MDGQIILLALAFFSIALVYSSVGFGGGSSYLALLAIMNLPMMVVRPLALICNIIVVSGGTWHFARQGLLLDWKKIWPFLILSVPLAWLGASLKLTDRDFFILLGCSLIVASMLLWVRTPEETKPKSGHTALNAFIGGGIGFLSGLVGIGGGIFLSPVLHFLKWDNARKISALASLFILVNSVSGLYASITKPGTSASILPYWPLAVGVVAGGQIGSRLGSRRFDGQTIKRITAVLIFIAGVNILRDHL